MNQPLTVDGIGEPLNNVGCIPCGLPFFKLCSLSFLLFGFPVAFFSFTYHHYYCHPLSQSPLFPLDYPYFTSYKAIDTKVSSPQQGAPQVPNDRPRRERRTQLVVVAWNLVVSGPPSSSDP